MPILLTAKVRSRTARLGILLACARTLGLGAQEPSVSALLSKNLGNVPGLIAALRNASGAYSRAQRTAIADALAENATLNQVTLLGAGDSASYAASIRAVSVLGHSASVQPFPVPTFPA